MVWPFGSSSSSDGGDKGAAAAAKAKAEAISSSISERTPIPWSETIGQPDEAFSAALDWAPVVGASLASLGLLQLYANYLRRIPGAAFVRPSMFRRRSVYGRVTSVGDGDNFHLFHTPGGRAVGWGWLRRIPTARKELKDRTIAIRLAGIDAPEGAHFGKPAQPFSSEALEWLRGYIGGRSVRAYPYKRDHYNRIVATVYVRRLGGLLRRNVGLEMVRRGLATTYEAKSGAEFGGIKHVYEAAEAKARRKKLGIWSGRPAEFESPRDYKTKWQGVGEQQQQDQHGKK